MLLNQSATLHLDGVLTSLYICGNVFRKNCLWDNSFQREGTYKSFLQVGALLDTRPERKHSLLCSYRKAVNYYEIWAITTPDQTNINMTMFWRCMQTIQVRQSQFCSVCKPPPQANGSFWYQKKLAMKKQNVVKKRQKMQLVSAFRFIGSFKKIILLVHWHAWLQSVSHGKIKLCHFHVYFNSKIWLFLGHNSFTLFSWVLLIFLWEMHKLILSHCLNTLNLDVKVNKVFELSHKLISSATAINLPL